MLVLSHGSAYALSHQHFMTVGIITALRGTTVTASSLRETAGSGERLPRSQAAHSCGLLAPHLSFLTVVSRHVQSIVVVVLQPGKASFSASSTGVQQAVRLHCSAGKPSRVSAHARRLFYHPWSCCPCIPRSCTHLCSGSSIRSEVGLRLCLRQSCPGWEGTSTRTLMSAHETS